MTAFLIILIILVLLGILGAVVKGLLWLTFAAIVLLLAGAAYGWFKYRSKFRSSNTT